MSNLNNRLAQLEKQDRAKTPPRIFVILDGQKIGRCNGAIMTRAEWEATATPQDITLNVIYTDKQTTGE